MDRTVTSLSHQNTGFFSKIVSDYLQQVPTLQPFYTHSPNLEGIQAAIQAREAFDTPRNLLVEVLEEQYATLSTSEKTREQIRSLNHANTFTVVTAHQPNIFTGPLYFIYKILHTIQLAAELNAQLPHQHFVPVYYMGSEDADLDELGFITVDEKKLVWDTKQTGAVGRMKVDKSLLKLIHALEGQLGVLPFGMDLVKLFRTCYVEGRAIQEATLQLVDALFGAYGLVVVIPDHRKLKSAFSSVVKKELTERFSHAAVQKTIAALSNHYKVQAGGRELNLFYLLDDKRERIEYENGIYSVKACSISFTKDEILQELANYPERFSANVILRGAFQETILPNVAFIGGGGELAYWLELKSVFAAAQIPYPVLMIRNSFLLLHKTQEERIEKLGYTIEDIFQETSVLINKLVQRDSKHQLNLSDQMQQAQSFYAQLKEIAGSVDASLAPHVASLEAKATKRLVELEKKILRAEKRKFESQQRQIQGLKQALFPENSLQERVTNFSTYYATYGPQWLQMILDASKGIAPEFIVLTMPG